MLGWALAAALGALAGVAGRQPSGTGGSTPAHAAGARLRLRRRRARRLRQPARRRGRRADRGRRRRRSPSSTSTPSTASSWSCRSGSSWSCCWCSPNGLFGRNDRGAGVMADRPPPAPTSAQSPPESRRPGVPWLRIVVGVVVAAVALALPYFNDSDTNTIFCPGHLPGASRPWASTCSPGSTARSRIGHGAFFGIGAFTTAILDGRPRLDDRGHDPGRRRCSPRSSAWPSASRPCGCKGLYLALITLGLAVLFPLVVSEVRRGPRRRRRCCSRTRSEVDVADRLARPTTSTSTSCAWRSWSLHVPPGLEPHPQPDRPGHGRRAATRSSPPPPSASTWPA